MQNALIDDWKARLHLMKTRFRQDHHDVNVTRFFFRLLARPSDNSNCFMALPFGISEKISRIIGESDNPQLEKRWTSTRVLPCVPISQSAEIWKVVDKSIPPIPVTSNVMQVISNGMEGYIKLFISSQEVYLPNKIECVTRSRPYCTTLTVGSIIEIQCEDVESMSLHYPIIRQTNCLSQSSISHSQRLQWKVCFILMPSTKCQANKILFLLQPEYSSKWSNGEISERTGTNSQAIMFTHNGQVERVYRVEQSQEATKLSIGVLDASVSNCHLVICGRGSNNGMICLGMNEVFHPRQG